ncbi:MAG: hypothetical protein KF862_25030 [Chitinophagaceae bacterium]|nr:hypothetical protein [Chitinophagaceae bacterium]
MAKKTGFFLALAGIALAAALYWYTKPRQGVGGKPADWQVTAMELYNAYNDNEQAADQNFLNAVIEVKGIVEDIQVNADGAVVILSMQPGGGGISCRFSPAAMPDTATISRGAPAVIKGRCTGFNMDVNLTDCEIIL